MSGYLLGGALAVMFALQAVSPFDLAQAAPSRSQGATPAPAPVSGDAAKEIRLNGCIARDKAMPGQFTFLDNESGGKYRLTGRASRISSATAWRSSAALPANG